MFLFGLTGGAGEFDPLILILLALLIEAVLGGRVPGAGSGAPLGAVFSGLADWFDRKLNRRTRSQVDRAMRGGIVVLVVVALSVFVGWWVAWASQTVPLAWIFELVLLVGLISQRRLLAGARAVGRALRAGDLEDVKWAAAALPGPEDGRGDAHGLARITIEAVAEGYTREVAAPVFFYALFGFPGILAYRAATALAQRLGGSGEAYRAFGFAAARLEAVLTLIPARLGGLFVVLACLFVPTARPVAALKTMVGSGARVSSVNTGWQLGAFAGALDLALAGPDAGDAWIGEGTAQATHMDVGRALYIFAVACLINAAAVGALTLFRFG
jgi:adenosylcobinamide-phosphate synthase